MAIKTYVESGMQFHFEERDLLLPELEAWYTRWQGVKMVDFIWMRNPRNLFIVEVKTSCPNFNSGKPEDKTDYIQSLFEKFNAAIHATMGMTIKIPNYHGFIAHHTIHRLGRFQNKIRMVLIIKSAKKEWLDPIKNAINSSSLFQNLSKTTGISFVVVTPELARRYLKMEISLL